MCGKSTPEFQILDSGGRSVEGVVRILDPDEVFAPGGWILDHQTPQAGLQNLVQPLRLTIGLGVIARGKAGRDPHETAELLPKFRDKLGAMVRHNVHRETVDAEHMVAHVLHCFLGGRQLGQGYEVNHFWETVHYSENSGVTCQCR